MVVTMKTDSDSDVGASALTDVFHFRLLEGGNGQVFSHCGLGNVHCSAKQHIVHHFA